MSSERNTELTAIPSSGSAVNNNNNNNSNDDGNELDYGPSMDPAHFASPSNAEAQQQQQQRQQQQATPSSPSGNQSFGAGSSSHGQTRPSTENNTPSQNQLTAPNDANKNNNNNNNSRKAPKKIHPAEEPPVPARPVPIPSSDIPPRLRGLYGKAELLFYSVVLRRTASGFVNKNKPGLLFLTPSALFILDMSFMVTRYVPVGEIASPCGVFEQTKQVLIKPINDVEILVSFPEPSSPDLDENSQNLAAACGNRGLAQFVRCLYAAHFFAQRPADVPTACNPPLRLTKMPPDVMLKSLSRSARASQNSADRQAKIEMRLKNEMNKNSGITRPHAAQALAEDASDKGAARGVGDANTQRDQEGAGAAGNFQPDMKLKQLAEQYVDEDGQKRQAALAAAKTNDGLVVGPNGDRVPAVVALAQKYANQENPAGQQQQQQPPSAKSQNQHRNDDDDDDDDEEYEEEEEEGESDYSSSASGFRRSRDGSHRPSQSQQSQSHSRAASEYSSHPSQHGGARRDNQQQQPQHQLPSQMSASNFMSPQQQQQQQLPSQSPLGQQTSQGFLSASSDPSASLAASTPVGQQFARTGALPRVRAPGNRESLALMALCYASFVRVADFSLPEHLARTPSGAPHPIMPYLLQSVLFTINPTGNAIFWRPMVEAPLWSFNALHDVEAIHFRRGGLISILVRPYGGRSQPCKMTIQPMLYRPNIGGYMDPDELKTVEADITVPAEREELIRSAKSLLEVLHALAPNVQFTVDRPDSSSRTTSLATSARDGSQQAGGSPSQQHKPSHDGTSPSDRSPSQQTSSSQQTGSAVANALGPAYRGGDHNTNNSKDKNQHQRHHHRHGAHQNEDTDSQSQSPSRSHSHYTGESEDESHRSSHGDDGRSHSHINNDESEHSSSQSPHKTRDFKSGDGSKNNKNSAKNPPPSSKQQQQQGGYPMEPHQPLRRDAGGKGAGKGDDYYDDYENERGRGGEKRGGDDRGGGRNREHTYPEYDDEDRGSSAYYNDSEYDDDRERHRGGRRGGGGGIRGQHSGQPHRRDPYDSRDDYQRRGAAAGAGGAGAGGGHFGGGAHHHHRGLPRDQQHQQQQYYDDEGGADNYSQYTPSDYSRGESRSMPRRSERAVAAVLRGVPVSRAEHVQPIETSADVPVDAVKIMSEVDWRSIIQQDPVTAATVMADAQQQWEMERAAIAHELLRMHEERSLLLGQNDALQHQVSEILDGRGDVVVDVQKLSQQCFQLQQQLQAERKIRQQSVDDNVYKTERFFEGVIVSQQDEVDVLKERLRRLEGVLERVGDAAGSSPKYKYASGSGAATRGDFSPFDRSGAAAPPPNMHIGSEGPFTPSAIGYHPSTVMLNRSAASNPGNINSSSPSILYPQGTISGLLATSPNIMGGMHLQPQHQLQAVSPPRSASQLMGMTHPQQQAAATPNQAFMKSPAHTTSATTTIANDNSSNNNNNVVLQQTPQGLPAAPPNSPYYGGPSPPRPNNNVSYLTSPYATPASRAAILSKHSHGSGGRNADDQSLRYSLMMDT